MTNEQDLLQIAITGIGEFGAWNQESPYAQANALCGGDFPDAMAMDCDEFVTAGEEFAMDFDVGRALELSAGSPEWRAIQKELLAIADRFENLDFDLWREVLEEYWDECDCED